MANQIYDWFGLNKSLFLLINSIHTPFLDRLMLVVTYLGHPQLYPFYIAFMLVLMWRKPSVIPPRNIVTFSVSYVLISTFIIPLLKASFDFHRPLAVLGEQTVIILGNQDTIHSFPSGHSAYAILMAASLAPGVHWKAKTAIITFALLVCISRISVGAHFPADVIGSIIIAISVVSATRMAIGSQKINKERCKQGNKTKYF